MEGKNMNRKIIVLIIAFVWGAALGYGQYLPPNGGNTLNDLASPSFLGGGASVTSLESPQADAINPAAAGLKQRTILDIGYIGLVGFGEVGDSGYRGHSANLGASFPSRVGVFTVSGHFVHSPFAGMDLGTLATARFSFAKDLYPDLLFGIGISFTYGSNVTADWSLAGNLGIMHLPGDIGFMKDFRWGLALQGLGKPFAPVPGRSPYPAPFTPVGGIAFDLVQAEAVRFGLFADLGFPFVQDIEFTLGGNLMIKETFGIQFATRFDLQEIVNPSLAMRSPVPSFGISFTFRTDIKEDSEFISERGWNRSEVKTQVAASPFQNNIWGIGAGVNIPLGVIDSEGPEITVEYDETEYISPDNDGESDTLVLPIRIEDRRYIKGYALTFYNDEGEPVREIRNKELRFENRGFRNIWDRLTYVKQGVEIPEHLRWDGNSDGGSLVPDGTYTFSLISWDDNGNTTTTNPMSVVVDVTDPEITLEVEAENSIFSPNDDGNKDTLTIDQSGSEEDLWEGEIYEIGGDTVRAFTWESGAPESFVWDGTNDDGILVPDGVYGYRVTSTDRAGNDTTEVLDNIVINTEATPITVSIDSGYFSPGDPNNDGAVEEINFFPNIPVERGIVDWTLEVLPADGGAPARVFTGTETVPERIVFDGRTDEGEYIREGGYRGSLSVLYANGNNPTSESPRFTADITEPFASVRPQYEIFSPNGDGRKDQMIFVQESSREDIWFGTIEDSEGNEIRRYTWLSQVDNQVTWDGYTGRGSLADDGEYTYRIYSTDRAGNTGESEVHGFVLDTEDTPVLVSVDKAYFSPNQDGIKESVTLAPKLERREGIVSYSMAVRSEDGETVKTYEGRRTIQESFEWNGIDDEGNIVPDGNYSAVIEVLYDNGNRPTAATRSFTVDTKYPDVRVSAEPKLFSPDGDGNKDTVVFDHEASTETRWTGKISGEDGTVVLEHRWSGQPGEFVWDGTDTAGNTVPDGRYLYTVASEDEAGNRTEKRVEGIRVDTRPTNIFLTVDANGLSPNGDGFMDTLGFNTIVNLQEGITEWTLEIVHSSGVVEKRFTGGAETVRTVEWNGVTESGQIREGVYTARFTVVYAKGNRPTVESKSFFVDITGPDFSITMEPKPFSPDNDGIDDELHISMEVSELSEVESWSFAILDPTRKPFYTFAGKGTPAEKLIWEGLSEEGELVQAAEDYPWTLEARDVFGNVSEQRGTIPVDVLVIREGDRLKIRISSITFEPNSPRLVIDDSDTGQKNQRVLERLAEILNKFKDYSIRIEGHAVSVYWYDTARAEEEEVEELQPLSLARANAVKEALVERGVAAKRITTAGLGGRDPVVPHGDLENRWKNRRVEFILIR